MSREVWPTSKIENNVNRDIRCGMGVRIILNYLETKLETSK